MASNGLKFWKYHGIGNDFVLIDARELKGIDWPALSTQMCDRHFGVGADGLLLLRPSEVASYTMGMYNPDGSEAQMCGNGIRGFAKHLVDHALVLGDEMTVETGAGVLGLRLHNDRNGATSVTVGMGKPITAGRRDSRRERPRPGPPGDNRGRFRVLERDVCLDGQPTRCPLRRTRSRRI